MTLLKQAEVDAMLEAPLTLAAAQTLALGNHREIAKQWALVASSRGMAMDAWKPAALSLHGTYHPGSAERFEIDIMQDLTSLIGAPARHGEARAGLRGAQLALLSAAYEVLREASWAYYEAQAAKTSLALAREALDAAAAGATLAQRLRDAGNITELFLLQAKDAHEAMRQVVWQRETQVAIASAALARALGVRQGTRLTLGSDALELPKAAPDLQALPDQAAKANLRVRGAVARADAATSARSASSVRQWLPSLGVGVSASYGDEGWELGPAAAISLPLFGQGRGARQVANAAMRVAGFDVELAASELAAAVAAAQARVASAHARARHLATVMVPLREQTLAAAVLQYNAMAQGPFELLMARQRTLEAQLMLIDVSKEFWQAIADVEALRRGHVPNGAAAAAPAAPIGDQAAAAASH
ncbi:MAG: TolC family protein [Myxococcales bacterium]|nr:TolC family protein [Myxococcales bacterium]